MKILWATDLHLKFSNLSVTKQLFDFILKTIKERNIKQIVLTGDINDTKAILRAETVSQLRWFCHECSKQSIKIFILVGNHDMVNNKDMKFGHSLEFLNDIPNVWAIDKPIVIQNIGKFIPYTEDNKMLMKELKNEEGVDYLFCHNGINGAHMNSKGVFDDFSISSAKYKNFKRVYVGHYHNNQTIDNIIYLGSPFSHSFAEANIKKYIGIIDLKTGSVELVEPRLRKHVDYTVKSEQYVNKDILELPEIRNEDLIRVFLFGTKEDNKKVYEIIKKTDNMKFIFKNEDRIEERIKIDPSESKNVLLNKYVNKINTTLDKKKLLEIGNEVLKNANISI